MPGVTVIKRDFRGQEVWRYHGEELDRKPGAVTLEAYFNRDDTPLGETVLLRGDRFVETYFSDRWYNVYEIHDRENGRLKVWYCNVGRPAVIENQTISYDDLALDLLVYPDGRQTVLDREEFEALPLDREERRKAGEALKALQEIFRQDHPVF
jgi:predicted RNA-binding protein associated with RNAse of E/G family